MRIDELFDKPPTIEWKKLSGVSWIGSFTVDDKQYGIKFFTFVPGSKETITVEFHVKQRGRIVYDPTRDDSNPFPVYSAVLNAILKYLETVKPDKLVFTGDANTGLGKFYKRLVKHITAKCDYTLKTFELPAVISFTLIRNGV